MDRQLDLYSVIGELYAKVLFQRMELESAKKEMSELREEAEELKKPKEKKPRKVVNKRDPNPAAS